MTPLRQHHPKRNCPCIRPSPRPTNPRTIHTPLRHLERPPHCLPFGKYMHIHLHRLYNRPPVPRRHYRPNHDSVFPILLGLNTTVCFLSESATYSPLGTHLVPLSRKPDCTLYISVMLSRRSFLMNCLLCMQMSWLSHDARSRLI